MNNIDDKIFIGTWVKKNGRLEFHRGVDKSLFNSLIEKLPEGKIIPFTVDFSEENGTLAQLAKLKAGTRAIARESGHHFLEVEKEIKASAGLYDEKTDVYKSFGNCSRDELGAAIHVLIEMGEFNNLNLR